MLISGSIIDLRLLNGLRIKTVDYDNHNNFHKLYIINEKNGKTITINNMDNYYSGTKLFDFINYLQDSYIPIERLFIIDSFLNTHKKIMMQYNYFNIIDIIISFKNFENNSKQQTISFTETDYNDYEELADYFISDMSDNGELFKECIGTNKLGKYFKDGGYVVKNNTIIWYYMNKDINNFIYRISIKKINKE